MSKKSKIIMISVSAAVVLAIALTLILYFTLRTAETINLSFTAAQVEDEQKIKVEWKASSNVDRVTINVKNSDNEIQNSVTLSTPTAIAKGYALIDASYGKQTVEVTVKKALGLEATQSRQVNVFTDEYVIAPLVATMPVTFFSLSLPEYSDN